MSSQSMRQILMLLAILCLLSAVDSFSVTAPSLSTRRSSFHASSTSFASHATDDDPSQNGDSSVIVSGQAAIDELPPERREALYQFLLRDLEIEGVPLLECDVDRSFTMQAALWLTLAQLQELDNEEDSRACLILSEMPMEALRALVEDTNELLSPISILSHIELSLVGRGVGPGLILSVNSTKAVPNGYQDDLVPYQDLDSVNSAVSSFLDRMRPEISSSDSKKSTATNSAEICEVLANVWNSVCEMVLANDPPTADDATSVLAIPYGNLPRETFQIMTDVLDATLSSTRATDLIDVTYFHPSNQNFDRRSPVPTVVIRKRGGVVNDEEVTTNNESNEDLQAALDKEMDMLK